MADGDSEDKTCDGPKKDAQDTTSREENPHTWENDEMDKTMEEEEDLTIHENNRCGGLPKKRSALSHINSHGAIAKGGQNQQGKQQHHWKLE